MENWCLFKKMRASKSYFLSNSDWGTFENDKYPKVIDGYVIDDIVQPLTENSQPLIGKNVKLFELHVYTVLKPVKICCLKRGIKSEILNLYE